MFWSDVTLWDHELSHLWNGISVSITTCFVVWFDNYLLLLLFDKFLCLESMCIEGRWCYTPRYTRLCPYLITCYIIYPSVVPVTLISTMWHKAPTPCHLPSHVSVYPTYSPISKTPNPIPPPFPVRSCSPLPSSPLQLRSVPRLPTTVKISETLLAAILLQDSTYSWLAAPNSSRTGVPGLISCAVRLFCW